VRQKIFICFTVRREPKIVENRWSRKWQHSKITHTKTSVKNDPVAHPASLSMGTGGFFFGVKRPGREADNSSPLWFEVLTAVIMKSTIFWDITPCSPLKVNRCLGGTCRLSFQGRRISHKRNQHEVGSKQGAEINWATTSVSRTILLHGAFTRISHNWHHTRACFFRSLS
jgi:hypothetical protein